MDGGAAAFEPMDEVHCREICVYIANVIKQEKELKYE